MCSTCSSAPWKNSLRSRFGTLPSRCRQTSSCHLLQAVDTSVLTEEGGQTEVVPPGYRFQTRRHQNSELVRQQELRSHCALVPGAKATASRVLAAVLVANRAPVRFRTGDRCRPVNCGTRAPASAPSVRTDASTSGKSGRTLFHRQKGTRRANRRFRARRISRYWEGIRPDAFSEGR